MKMDRREFLRKAGLGSVALASLPTFANALAKTALAQGGTNFTFLGVNRAGPAGTAAQPAHTLVMGGQGNFDPSRVASHVEGGGPFFHFTAPAAAPPFPLIASGTWKARLLVSYKQLGTYGVGAAGILEMVVDIFRQVPSPATIRGATLKIVCNLPPAGLENPGEIEGYTLTIPGTDFFVGGTPGPFRSIPPGGAATLFSTVPLG